MSTIWPEFWIANARRAIDDLNRHRYKQGTPAMDTSKIQVGDTVHVRGTIIADGLEGPHVRFEGGDRANVAYGDIVHVEPRALAVGDTVKFANVPSMPKWRGEIIGIHGGKAWVCDDDGPATRYLKDLVRA